MKRWIQAAVFYGLAVSSLQAVAEAIPVEIVQRDGGWVMLRGGEPYVVRGAGIDGVDFESLATYGGNSVRTWATNTPTQSAQELLDNAHALGLTVSLCLNIARERHGFDYDDPEAVAEQFEAAKADVLAYRDHPALLTWIIGNELNYDYENPRVYDAVNEIAEMIHELDPNHPATTTTAGMTPELFEVIEERAPALDFISIQVYGALFALDRTMRDIGYEGPYAITEWGTIGHWEMPSTPWGAPIEQDSSGKARTFQRGWDEIIEPNLSQVIANYVFLWGQKQERTSTWYGMFTDRGERTEPVDILHRIWTGQWPDNRTPEVDSFTLDRRVSGANVELRRDREYRARMRVSDPEGGPITWRWQLLRESTARQGGGDREMIPPEIPGKVEDHGDGEITISTDLWPGLYRIFGFAIDDAGNAAHANIPFRVR